MPSRRPAASLRGADLPSPALETLLLDADVLTTVQRRKLRGDVLRSCERDTVGMVRLYKRLLALAENRTPHKRTVGQVA